MKKEISIVEFGVILKLIDVYEGQRMLLKTFQRVKAYLERQRTICLLQMELCGNKTN